MARTKGLWHTKPGSLSHKATTLGDQGTSPFQNMPPASRMVRKSSDQDDSPASPIRMSADLRCEGKEVALMRMGHQFDHEKCGVEYSCFLEHRLIGNDPLRM